jgi:hypothetical protein
MKRVVAGHKANLHNARTSEESKEASRAFIARMEGGEEDEHEAEVHHNRVVGGHKAALKNEHT